MVAVFDGGLSILDDVWAIIMHRRKVREAAARRRTAKQRKRRHLARARR